MNLNFLTISFTESCSKIEKEQVRYRLPDYQPGFHCWDSDDPRYLICEANHRIPNAVCIFMLWNFY